MVQGWGMFLSPFIGCPFEGRWTIWCKILNIGIRWYRYGVKKGKGPGFAYAIRCCRLCYCCHCLLLKPKESIIFAE